MKAKRQSAKPTFDPIIITLETEEEAEFLWHLLRCKATLLEELLLKDENYEKPTNRVRVIDFAMWVQLDRVYSPKGKDC